MPTMLAQPPNHRKVATAPMSRFASASHQNEPPSTTLPGPTRAWSAFVAPRTLSARGREVQHDAARQRRETHAESDVRRRGGVSCFIGEERALGIWCRSSGAKVFRVAVFREGAEAEIRADADADDTRGAEMSPIVRCALALRLAGARRQVRCRPLDVSAGPAGLPLPAPGWWRRSAATPPRPCRARRLLRKAGTLIDTRPPRSGTVDGERHGS